MFSVCRTCSVYHAADNQLLEYGKKVSFPIIPVINAYAEEGEEIEVISVVSDYENAEHNFDIFCDQLGELCTEKKLKLKNGKPFKITVPYNELLDTQIERCKQK